MRIFSKKSKLIVVGFVVFLACYLTLNYIDSYDSAGYVDYRIKLFNLAEQQHDPNHRHHHHNHEHNVNLNKPKPTTTAVIENIPIINLLNETNDKQVETRPKRRFLAYDGGGFGSVNARVVQCGQNIEVEITGSRERLKQTDFSYFHMNAPGLRLSELKSTAQDGKKEQYVMVYTMESEVHSFGGNTWNLADFRMWYNLDLSFPEPATYFDVRAHLSDLLSPALVPFEAKEKNIPIVWVVSNCNAYNGRERFMKSLMEHVGVDSYGGCMKNKFTHPNEHMKDNIQLYSKYKFVISIENSNCDDYVTEKLVHAVASGSIPIVAGKENKPNYFKFMPKGSYINVYDFKSVQELAEHLKAVAADRAQYEKYIRFKRNNLTRAYLKELTLPELIEEAKSAFGGYQAEKQFFDGIVAKESSEDKLCKLGRYLASTPAKRVREEVEARRSNRPDASVVCLRRSNLASDYNDVKSVSVT